MTTQAGDRPTLEVEDLLVRFGGLVAVRDVSLVAGAGVITGLIGPNGAGKTTTFNACSGLNTPQSGTIRLGGEVLNGRTPSQRAQLGLGRTFQRIALFESMTVRANVAIGREARDAGRNWRSRLCATRQERLRALTSADEALARCGIGDLGDVSAGDLSTGQRRLVELARALTGQFRFLLLDEPSSGLDIHETEAFGRILLEVVGQGTGILLVEHDMALVRQVCQYVYVLDFGQLIFQGPTDAVLASDVVRAAYLGTEAA